MYKISIDHLSQLADKYKTDKGLWHHGYTPIYNRYFEQLKDSYITLLEIGIGGYEYENKGGESLRMWRDYFTNAKIIGFDFYKKELQNLDLGELEKVLSLVEQLELELVEEGKIEEGEYESRLIEQIKEMLYNESIK
jgi:hypothetical protein